MATLTRRSYARVGLLGNPSDGYHGRTISVLIENYFAEVTLEPSDDGSVHFVPHWEHDALDFASLAEFTRRVQRNGFYGGLRLLWSAVVQFCSYHESRGCPVPPGRGFRLSYITNIPKQAGLSGSSAIVTACVSCLEALFGPEFVIPHARRPNVVLAAETALGITAGLQDRVIQTYGGCMLMDFDKEYMRSHDNCGDYTRLPAHKLPRLWLIWGDNPGDSGAVHANVRQRYDAGDTDVIEAMNAVAMFPVFGKDAILTGDVHFLAKLMSNNFQRRRLMFGDAALGAFNLHMVEVASKCGAGAKFTGSGGAIVALCPHGEAQEAQLRQDCADARLNCELIRVHVPDPLPEAGGDNTR